ncbi:MAG: hypothetical protein JSR30_13075 [Proteobacteria bacterium]|nr:hypothetical protein [Pseudomonadota bacterium]
MARDAYQDEQTQKRQAVEDVYKARADERADEASKRENERLDLMRTTEQRQQQRLDETERQQRLALATGALEKSIADLETTAKARQLQNMPVDPEDGKRYGKLQAQLRAARQESINFFTRVQGGQMSLNDAPPKDLYLHLVRATGMTPQEMAQMPQHIKDIQDGLQYRNDDLQIKGINGLLGPTYLKRGVGEPSPYGGTITKKEVVRLVPARDANGVDHPDKVYPILRVYTDQMGPDGQPLYYDAAMTREGTTDPGDEIVPIDLKRGFDFMGNMGTLAELMKRPEIAARLEQGEKEGGAEARKYLEDLTARTKPVRKIAKTEQVDLGDRKFLIRYDEAGNEVSREEMRKGAVPRILAPRGGAGGAGEPTIDDETLTSMAEQYLAGDKSVFQNLGRGAQGAANVVALRQRVTQVAKEAGMTPDQIALVQNEFQGMGAAQRALGTRSANFGLAEKEAYAMADLVTEASSKVPRTQFMPINKAIIAYENNTGDPETRQFGAALNSFINAYARAVSPIGTPTVSDKDHARSMLSTADSHEALTAIMGQLKREMDAAGAAPGAVQKQIRGRQAELSERVRNRPRGGGGNQMPTFGSEADAAAAAKAGKIKPGDRITINGQTGTWQ